jgi:uncharacterized protein YkwD
MQWATATGIINGTDGKLNPQGKASRAQAAQIYANFKQLKAVELPVAVELIIPEASSSVMADWENYNPEYDLLTGKLEIDADGGYYDYDLANEVMEQVNSLRRKNSLAALLYNPKIQVWASIRAQESSILFAHARPNGSDCLSVGQGLCFENLLWADDYTDSNKENMQAYAADVVTAWYNSDSHRISMLSSVASLGAISCYIKGNHVYIAHLFSMKTLYYMDCLIK